MLISIDPSYNKPIGIAWLDSGEIKYASVLEKVDYNIKTRDLHKIALKVFDFLITLLDNSDTKTVLIESQWLGRNPKMFSELLTVRVLITGLLLGKYRDDIKVIDIMPITWQNKILNSYKLKSDAIKILSIKKAAELTKSNPTEDESDAICMLKYGIENLNVI